MRALILSLPLFAFACAPSSVTLPEEGVEDDAAGPAAPMSNPVLVSAAGVAESLCNGGDWCLYGAMRPDTAYDPSPTQPAKGTFDSLMGDTVLFAVSFDASWADEYVEADPLVWTWYDMKVVDVQMLSSNPSFTDVIAVDVQNGVPQGISLWYNWYTNQTSAVPAMIAGYNYNFEVHIPEDAPMAYTPNSLPEDYPELTDGKGDGIGILRAYVPGTYDMVDFVTGEAFTYLVAQ